MMNIENIFLDWYYLEWAILLTIFISLKVWTNNSSLNIKNIFEHSLNSELIDYYSNGNESRSKVKSSISRTLKYIDKWWDKNKLSLTEKEKKFLIKKRELIEGEAIIFAISSYKKTVVQTVEMEHSLEDSPEMDCSQKTVWDEYIDNDLSKITKLIKTLRREKWRDKYQDDDIYSIIDKLFNNEWKDIITLIKKVVEIEERIDSILD